MGSFAFLNPWALLGLLALPVLYFLLRITPPAPKIVAFPALRLLADLKPKQNTPSHTPWWILLLRMLMAALLIVALARPVLNPSENAGAAKATLLVIDNAWSAAQNWDAIQNAAAASIQVLGRRGAAISVLSTAAVAENTPRELLEVLAASDALSMVKGLKPQPFKPDYPALLPLIKDFKGDVVWLSDGVLHAGHTRFLDALKLRGDVTVTIPPSSDLPFALVSANGGGVAVEGARNVGFDAPLRVQMLGARGDILDEVSVDVADQKFPLKVAFEEQNNNASAYRIAGQKGVQGRYLLDQSAGPKSVGIVAADDSGAARQLTEDHFYLNKALEPYAEITQGTLAGVLTAKPAVIILPDVGAMTPDILNDLSEWVRNGGLLLRFAGPNMTQGNVQDVLMPMPLSSDARNVEGALSWNDPIKFTAFDIESPLYGIALDKDVSVSGQILPEASGVDDERVWAVLEDGTPIITAREEDAGLIVMVHTSASPAWSNFALSGMYVQVLKRVVSFAGQSHATRNSAAGLLQPVQIMDGFGVLQSPSANVQPIDSTVFDDVMPSPKHPPGIYGRGAFARVLNGGTLVGQIRALDADVLEGVRVERYGQVYERDLVPSVILAVLILFLLDAAVMIFMARSSLRKAFAVGLVLCLFTPSAYAQNPAQDLYLGYIKTGNVAVDATTARGLEVLAAGLRGRSSAEPAGVIALDVEADELAFFPLIYWALDRGQSPPSSKAVQNLQAYLDHGGTIMVDTRGLPVNQATLKPVIGGLNIAPLAVVPKDHVLTKSFYLLKQGFPGRSSGQDVWIESQSESGRDGVSSVLIGSHDWAGAWSEMNVMQRGERVFVRGATPRHEQSLRFGINMMMYALSGNYKADQVHVPHILKRLGGGGVPSIPDGAPIDLQFDFNGRGEAR